jgi:LysR family transcriptional regulator, regulator for genes of the gallate degradation pathway
MDSALVTLPVSLVQLRCFAACARLGALGRAADSIGLSQSAASEAIAALEQACGTALLHRHPGGCTQTAAGAILNQRAGRLLARLEAALAAAAPAARNPLPSLRMAQLRAHLAVARQGSFAAAAVALGLSVPAVQRAARSLEAHLRVPLYRSHPGGRGVTPTGAELARQMALALAELAQARQELAQDGAQDGAQGGATDGATPLIIGILPLVPKRLLARLVAQRRDATPSLTIRESSATVLLDHLRWARIDAILGAVPDQPPGSDVQLHPLLPDPWVIAARAGHPLRHGASRAALASHPWVVPTDDLPRHAAIQDVFAAMPSKPPIWLRSDSLGTVLAIVAETDCLTVLAHSQLALGDAPGLAVIPAGPVGPARRVSLARRADWLPTPGQRAVLDSLAQLVRDAPQMASQTIGTTTIVAAEAAC